jgi:mannosyltransferase OCH1-like enzyme
MSVPKIIHQIWIGSKPAPLKLMNTWKEKQPDFEYIFWNEEEFVKRNMIFECQNRIDEIEEICGKTDIMRWEILYRFGGIYVDADTEPLKRMPEIILNYNFFSGYQPNNEIAIGIMGSRTRESLVTFYIDSVLQNINKFIYDGKVSNEIWKISGPEFFTQFLNPYLNNPTYKFFEVKYFYPYAWYEMERKQENFSITSPESYSVHHWAKSWIS